MSGYTKLDASIVTSTVWAEALPTKVVWITMLALADADGLVDATVPGLARVAGVTVQECRIALEKFLAPDTDSRSQDYDGRRIERAEGVFRLLNYTKYRYKNSEEWRREQDAAKHRRQRATQRDANGTQRDGTGRSGTEAGRQRDGGGTIPMMSHQAEAEAEAEEEEEEEKIGTATNQQLGLPVSSSARQRGRRHGIGGPAAPALQHWTTVIWPALYECQPTPPETWQTQKLASLSAQYTPEFVTEAMDRARSHEFWGPRLTLGVFLGHFEEFMPRRNAGAAESVDAEVLAALAALPPDAGGDGDYETVSRRRLQVARDAVRNRKETGQGAAIGTLTIPEYQAAPDRAAQTQPLAIAHTETTNHGSKNGHRAEPDRTGSEDNRGDPQ